MKPKKIEITQKELKTFIDYDPLTGIITNKIGRGNIPKGKILGSISKKQGRCSTDYYTIAIDKKSYQAHRIIMFYMLGTSFDQDLVVDHKDGNGLNNKWNNLEQKTQSGNAKNQKIDASKTKSKVTGITKDKNGKWMVRIGHENKRIYIGTYGSWFESVCARKSAEVKYGYTGR